jgi:hypothetical protein
LICGAAGTARMGSRGRTSGVLAHRVTVSAPATNRGLDSPGVIPFSIFFRLLSTEEALRRVEPTGCPRPEPSSMPLNPRRVQAVFLEAADYHDPVDRAAILDRECSAELELRGRVEALLRAHDEFNRFLNDPVGVTASPFRPNPLLSD